MNKQQLIECIKAELVRQGQLDQPGTPYIYDEEDESYGIDGHVDLTKLADVILEAMSK